MKPTQNLIFSLVIILSSQNVFADRGVANGSAVAVSSTSTSSNTTSTTVPQAQTIKTIATDNQSKTKYASYAAMGVGLYCGVKAVPACTAPPSWWCAAFVACVGLSYRVNSDLSKVSDIAGGTVGAVDFGNLSPGATSSLTTPSGGSTSGTDYNASVNAAKLNNIKKQLEQKGWKINASTGAVTDPSGKSFSVNDFKSQAAMNSAGLHGSFSQVASEMAKAKKEGEALAAKGSDGFGDAFADTPAGAGSSAAAVSVGNVDGTQASVAPAIAGIDRNPAQVAGMSKSFNGESIGVAKDSLFDMVDRRYELHKQNGNFLAP